MELKGFTLTKEEEKELVKYGLYDDFLKICNTKDKVVKELEKCQFKMNNINDINLSFHYFEKTRVLFQKLHELLDKAFDIKKKVRKLKYEEQTNEINNIIKSLI